jgi:Escherichia/Staphylococcus phage prohead protease
MKKREYRATLGLELRQESGEPLKIRGYAAVFNVLSEGLWFRERILPGAFKNSLKNDVRALVGHDSTKLLGRTPKTLDIREDEKGLYVEIQPPDTSLGHDTVESIRRGDMDQMSIGFYTTTDQWKTENKEEVRELVDVDLFDVSVVAFPAYKQTSASVRSLWPDGVPEELEKLRDAPIVVIPEAVVPPTEPAKPNWARLHVEELEKKWGLVKKP